MTITVSIPSLHLHHCIPTLVALLLACVPHTMDHGLFPRQSLSEATCEELKRSIHKSGAISTAFRGTRHSHLIGQIVAATTPAGELEMAISELAHLTMLVKVGQAFNGLYHGSAWYASAVFGLSWDRICLKISPEWIINCMHGLGHAGWIHMLMPQYSACSSLATIPWSVDAITQSNMLRAFATCRRGPRWAIESCAMGYYHGFFEYVDYRAMNVTWMHPCDTAWAPRTEACFMALFLTLVQATSDNSSPVMIYRRNVFDAHGNLSTCSLVSLVSRAACIYGLSSNIYATSYNNYYDMLIVSEMNLIKKQSIDAPTGWRFADVCSKLVQPIAAAQWLACIAGSVSGSVAVFLHLHLIPVRQRLQSCSHLSNMGPVRLRATAYGLCVNASRYNAFNYIPPGASQQADEFGMFKPPQPFDYRNFSLLWGFDLYLFVNRDLEHH